MRQTPTGSYRSSWQSTGISMPMSFAACQIVVPSGTVTSWPSIIRLTVLISVGAGVEMATVSSGFSRLDRMDSMKRARDSTGSPDGYPEPEILHLLRSEQTGRVQAAGPVVLLDHGIQALAGEGRGSPGRQVERLVQEAVGKGVVAARPALAGVERALGEDDPAGGRLELVSVDVPAGHRAQQPRPLGERVVEDAPQELAEDERVHDGRAILRADRGGDVGRAAAQAVVAPGEVGFVGARAVVVGAARVDRETERHRLQGARLVARQLEALDLRGEGDRSLADDVRRGARALGQQRAEPLARADLVDRAEHRIGIAEAQPRRVDEAALGGLHRPRDRAAGGNRVEPVLVAAAARLEHGVRIRDAAQRAE